MRRKQNFEQVLDLKVTQQSSCLLSTCSPPLFFFRFSCFIFVLLLGIQQASFWWEIFLGKHLGSQNQMKGKVGEQWNKIFMEIFRSMLHVFLPLSPVSLTELCSFWYGLKDFFTLHKLSLTIKNDDVTYKWQKGPGFARRSWVAQGFMG